MLNILFKPPFRAKLLNSFVLSFKYITYWFNIGYNISKSVTCKSGSKLFNYKYINSKNGKFRFDGKFKW